MDAFLDMYYDGATNYASRIYMADDTDNAQAEKIADRYDGDWSSTVSVQIDDDAVALDKMCIRDRDRITAMLNNKITAGLIGYVEDGVLSDRGIHRACDVLNTHRMMAERVGVKELFVFATASLRNCLLYTSRCV